MKNKFLLMLCILVISLLPATSVAAKASAIVINGKDGNVYEYQCVDLEISAVAALLGSTSSDAALYNDFISRKASIEAYFDDRRQVYVDSDTVFKAAVNAVLLGNSFNFQAFMEDKNTPTITLTLNTITNDNGIIKVSGQKGNTTPSIDMSSIQCSNPVNNSSTSVTFKLSNVTNPENYTVTVKDKTAIYNATTGLFGVTLDGKLVTTDFMTADFTITKNISTTTISKIDNITATVAKNASYTLPTMVSATMSDGSIKNVSVTWDKTVNTSQVGTYIFNGTVDGYSSNVVLTLTVNTSNDSVVTFKDKNLEQAVRNAINKSTGDIYKNDVEKITELTIGYEAAKATETIEDISGIENLTNLQSLNLHDNQINDINPLKNLTKLQQLYLSANQISDISVLKNLTNLQYLDLGYNKISDISALSGLINLQWLDLGYTPFGGTPIMHPFPITYNQISDISALKNLTNLQSLNLGYNKISDISPLQGLTNLQYLDLTKNQISDISSLNGLSNLNELDLGNNKINDISCILALKCPHLGLLDLSYNQISDISVFKGSQTPILSISSDIYLFGNQISDADIQCLKSALPRCMINEIIAKKPNIYLYPEKTEELSVYVTPKGKITKSIPEYNEGWKVTVDPSGKIDNTYDFLFYEASLNYQFTLDKGWIVNKDNFNEEMNNILTSIGLNSKEKADFIEYWSKELTWQSSRYAVYYLDPKEINEAIKLNISKEPDSILRVFFYFVPLNDNDNLEIKKPEIKEFKRNGFTVVEWGGICK